jgi:hypothetical protein
VLNDISEVPSCVCGEKCVPNKLNNKLGFTEYCGPACSAKYRRTPKELFDKDWLHRKRIEEHMSYQAIADLLGTSDVMVGKWCRKHKIAEVKYVWSDSATPTQIESRNNARVRTQLGEEVVDALSAYKTFEDLYTNKDKSVAEIAETFGTSEATVRRAAEKVGFVLYRKPMTVSRGEVELREFISSLVECIPNYRPTSYHDKELDIFVPSLNIGFEYNGCYFHSELFKDKYYHKEKVEFYRNIGIKVINIWSDDWEFNQERTKNFIRNALGKNPRIGARETTVRFIDHHEYDEFLETHHMLGGNFAGVRIGLFVGTEIVAVMGFKQIPSNVGKTGWDLCRFSNKNVTGGFSKLLKYFRLHYSGDIYSFADMEIVDRRNNVYTKNGFIEENERSVDYKYYDPKTRKRKHKFNYRKSTFIKMGIDISGKDEYQLCREYGLLRCYDSGKICYVLK